MSIFTGVPDIAADLISGTFGPIGAAAASLAEQTFTDNTVEEMKANNERYNEALNYSPRTDMGKAVNKGAMEAIGEGTAAVVNYYNENEEKIPDVVKSSVGAVADTWNDLDESTRFALGNLATVGEVVPIGKAASMLRRGSKLAPEDIMPDGVPTKDPMQPAPELQQNSALRLPAERAAMTPNVDELGYTSGIEEGIIAMINDPKVPDNVSAKQLMDLLKKRGVKDDEIEWSTFSDYVGTLGKQQIPLDEALRQAKARAISLEVVELKAIDEVVHPDYSPVGGTNYKELLFKFDTAEELMEERKSLRVDKDALKSQLKSLNDKRVQREQEIKMSMFDKTLKGTMTDKYAVRSAVRDEMPQSEKELKLDSELEDITDRIMDVRAKIESATFRDGHWTSVGQKYPTPNVIFHARVTDREIAGGKSLAIDEIQSDWHQGKGKVKNRPYYKLPEDKLKPYIQNQIKQQQIAYNKAAKNYDKSREDNVELHKSTQGSYSAEFGKKDYKGLYGIKAYKAIADDRNKIKADTERFKKELNDSSAELDNHIRELYTLDTWGYDSFTKDLRPNAPLKNKDKWMEASLNAMIFKAVKEGYDSISFPNGKTNSALYDGLEGSSKETLEKMYDTTVPNMLRKMTSKLDPDAVLVRGKHSSESNPQLTRMQSIEDDIYGEQEWDEFLGDGEIVDGDLYDRYGDLVERDINRRDFNREHGFLTDQPIELQYEDYMHQGGANRMSFEEYKKTNTKDEVNSAYSHIKITPRMREAVLKGKPLFLAEGGYVSGAADAVSGAVDVATDFLSGTFGPIGAAGASLAEQAFTDNTVEEMKANNEKYNDFLNYKPRTQMGRSANESFLETMGEGAEAVVNYYNENEENIPDVVKDTVGSVVDTWNDLDESTRFALGNLATVGEVLPMGKVASLAKRGISNASDTRRINRAASQVPDESEYYPVQDRLSAMGARQEMSYIEGQKGSATTQVATTVGSYKKAVKKAEDLNPKGKTVLDYGAGLGLGTDAMRSSSKLEVTSYEPFPERWKGDSPVDYTDSSLIPKKYDTVVNLNVLNVLEPELRDVVAKDIMSKVADGGVAIIGTRGWKGDIDATKKFKTTDEPQAIWVKKSSGDVYQKGFDGDELKDYMADLAPKGFRVERGKGIANNTVYVFNDNKPPKIDTEMSEIVGFEDGVAGLTRDQTEQALKDQHYRRLTPVGEMDHRERGTHTYSAGAAEGLYTFEMTEDTRQLRIKSYAKNLKNPAFFRREAYTLGKGIKKTESQERRIMHPEELLGKVGVPVVGDRSIRITGPDKESRAIVDINGVPLDSKHIPEGGMEYSRDFGGWASMDDAAKKKIVNFALAQDKTGIEDVLGIYTAMGREAINFSADAIVPMIKQLKAIRIPKEDIKAFDDRIRKGRITTNKRTGKVTSTAIPNWLGLEHPDVIKQLEGIEGDPNFPRKGAGTSIRKVVLAEMVKDEWYKKGFPDYNDIVDTMTVPELSDFRQGSSGLSMFKPEFKKGRDSDGNLIESINNSSATKSDHTSYGANIPGKYFGGLFASVPPHIMYPDTFKELSQKTNKAGDPFPFHQQVGSLEKKPTLYEVYTPEKIDNIIKYLNATHGTDYNEGGLVEEMDSILD